MVFLVAVALLCAAPAFSAESPESPAAMQPVLAPAAPAPAPGCGLDLAPLSGVSVQGETCKAPSPGVAAESQVPEFMASHRLGYCHCGCSTQRICRTSADCGGASCDQFISCC